MNRTRRILMVISVCVIMLLTSACKKDNTPFKHGTLSANAYTSEFLGIKIQAGSGWTMISDADIAKSNKISDMSESSIQTVFDKGLYITEMMITKDDGSSINITVQDNDKTISFSEKEYFSTGIDLIKAQFDAAGYTCDIKKGNVNFLGKGTDCIELSLTVAGTTVYEIQIPFFKSHYTASLTFASLKKEDLYPLLEMVTSV